MAQSSPQRPEAVSTLIDQLLADQRSLTAVERFAQKHGHAQTPSLAKHYRDLIPLAAPRPGEQYAFEVDLDQCSGCKGCVTACHTLNGLDDGEAWRSVGSLVGEAHVPRTDVSGDRAGGNRVIPLQQTVTTACHHCVEPACLLGCPVLAYDKDPVTGIVRHLDDQCIGCSYCILKCPYEVPQYSKKRGIVRKCDLCHGRLAEGEAPACVQACPNSAIKITTVSRTSISKEWSPIGFRQTNGGFPPKAATGENSNPEWLIDAPNPAVSLPTTRYRTRQPARDLRAANHYTLKPAAAHWPLILLLVGTQAGLGVLLGASLPTTNNLGRPGLATLGAALFFGGLGASVFHLGQPLKAWRAWLGWRTSWLSREAIVLHLIAGGVSLLFLLLTAPIWRAWPVVPPVLKSLAALLATVPLGLASLGLSLAILGGVATQAMVYADTKRRFWRFSRTSSLFFGTVLLFGTVAGYGGAANPSPAMSAVGLIGAMLALKIAIEVAALKPGDHTANRWSELNRSAQLLWGPLRRIWALRLVVGILGLGALSSHLQPIVPPVPATIFGLSLLLAGELLERYLYFAAASPDRMPGQAH